MIETIETLREQHQAVLARLDEVEAQTPGPPVSLQAFLDFLQGEVREHFGLEEEVLFPILAGHAYLAQGPVAVMEAEHHELNALFKELGNALRGGNAERSLRIARMIIALLRAHIFKEDNVLFPLAARVLTAAEVDEVQVRAAAWRRGANPASGPEQCKRG